MMGGGHWCHSNHCLVRFHLEQDRCEGKSGGSCCRCGTPVLFGSFISHVPASHSLDKVHFPLLDLFCQPQTSSETTYTCPDHALPYRVDKR